MAILLGRADALEGQVYTYLQQVNMKVSYRMYRMYNIRHPESAHLEDSHSAHVHCKRLPRTEARKDM
jgi:hypothetical protein